MNPIVKDTFREIGKTKGRFFSILGIVMVGVAFFSGIWASAPDMRYSADSYFDEYNLMDYRVLSNFGLTKDDISEIREIPGVKGVYPAYTMDFLVTCNNDTKVMKVSSFNANDIKNGSDDYINQFVLMDGRFPNSENEIVVEKSQMEQSGYKIGDKLTFSSGTDSPISDYLKNTEYTVVGLIHTPYYLSYEKGTSTIGSGSVNSYGYINQNNFDMEYYTEAFVTIDGAAAYNSYNTDYFEFLDSSQIQLEQLGTIQSQARYDQIMAEATAKLDDAKKQYQDGKLKFETEIANAEQKIEDGKNEIIIQTANLNASELVLNSQIASARMQIETSKQQLASLEQQIAIYQKQYEQANASLISQKQTAQQSLIDKQAQVDALAPQIAEINNQISALDQEITTKQNQVNANNATIAQNTLRINEINNQLATMDQSNPQYQVLTDEKNTLQSQNTELQSQNTALQTEIMNLNTQRLTLSQNPIFVQSNQLQLEITALNNQIAAIDQSLATGQSAINKLNEQVALLKQQISNGENEVNTQEANGKQQIQDGRAKIASAQLELANGEVELENNRKKGQEELDNALDEITKAEKQISEIDDAKWFVLNREYHYSYRDYQGATDRMENIAMVFPVFFFLVAALVCLTTMTRLVDEQRLQIGTMKALGYGIKEIAFKYLVYATLASLAGSVIGLLIGMTFFPWVIYTSWNLMYLMPSISFEFQPMLMLITVAISVFVTTGATLAACYKEIVATPATLMRPKSPKEGKKILLERIPFIWNNLSFTMKVTYRNIFRYKKRMFMTLIGIAGCTALLIAGFGIKDSISDIADIQFGEVIKYNGVLTYSKDANIIDKETIAKQISDEPSVDETMLTSFTNAKVFKDSKEKDVTLIAVNDTIQFENFYELRNRKSQKIYNLSSTGVLISEKMANDFKIAVGDMIDIDNIDGISGSFKVDGIYENYMNHYVVMSDTLYQNTFGIRAPINTLLIDVNNDDISAEESIAKMYLDHQGVSSISFYTSFINTFEDMIESLNIIVLVLVISAGLLAFIVLYNLTNVNISERQREIATLKVLGFHESEVRKYVYYENLILTLLGSLLGLALGKGLHLVIMVVVEMDDLMFGRNIDFISYIISIIFTLIFAIIVNLVMNKTLRNIKMVESLKSVE